MGRALDGIARRIRRGAPLAGAVEEIAASYAALEGDFRDFFPALDAFAREKRAALVGDRDSD